MLHYFMARRVNVARSKEITKYKTAYVTRKILNKDFRNAENLNFGFHKFLNFTFFNCTFKF